MAAPGFVAGSYSAVLGSAAIGTTRDGFHFRGAMHRDPIVVDEYGASEVDNVDSGGDVEITLDWCDYAAVAAALGVSQNAVLSGLPATNVGKLGSAMAQTLTLTPASWTTAGTAGPAGTPIVAAAYSGIFYAKLAQVVTDISFMLNHKMRNGPLTLKLLPDLSGTSANLGRTHKWGGTW